MNSPQPTKTTDTIIYEKEYVDSLVSQTLTFLSPADGTNYEVGDTLTVASTYSGVDSSKIVVQLTTYTTKQYKLKKYINGEETDEYKNDGEIYQESTTKESEVLSEDEYNLTINEKG